MALDRELISEIRRLDEYDLRRLVIFATGLISSRGEGSFALTPVPGGEASRDPAPGRRSYRQQLVRCGKKGCTRCPHGPYWYAYWREEGRLRSRYIGKQLPEGAEVTSSAPCIRAREILQ